MDYMLELASHPDMPKALDALRVRWAELFADTPSLAAAGAVDVLTKTWTRLFEGWPRRPPTSVADFEKLKDSWKATSQLVEKDLEDPHQNAAGVQPLIEEHPNVWIAQVVHEFYRLPELAADAWFELKYCDQFPHQLANHVRAHAPRVGWFGGQEAHDAAHRSAEMISPSKPPRPGTPPTDPKLRRKEITNASQKLVHKPPHFIQDLIDRRKTLKPKRPTRPPGR